MREEFRLKMSSARVLVFNHCGLGIAAALLLASGAGGAQSSAKEPQVERVRTLQIDMDARPAPSQFVTAEDGDQYLVYSLFIANWGGHDLRMARLDIEDAQSGQVLVSYDKQALENPFRQRITRLVDTTNSSPENRILPAGRTSLVTVGVQLKGGAARPAALRHRLLFEPNPALRLVKDDGSLTTELVSVSAPFPVSPAPPSVLGPPLRGGPWVCANGLAMANSHHAYIAASRTARLHVAQRFGCDFKKLDAGGNALPSPFPNDITTKMFYGYGEELLAVADGRVVAAQDGIPEGVPQVDGSIVMPVPLTEYTISGNLVVIDIGKSRYAFYAHLQPGSLRVKVGDRVLAGQVIGLLGFSGNAVGPHLHFHLGNSPSLNGTDGMPYVFKSYVFGGRWKPGSAPPQRMDRKVPLDGSVMTFPEGRNKRSK